MINTAKFMLALAEAHSRCAEKRISPTTKENFVLAYEIRNWAADRGFDVSLYQISEEFDIPWHKARALAQMHGFSHLLTAGRIGKVVELGIAAPAQHNFEPFA